jgi:2C-methyl-D-erythritol 2,4-cyclodiphosphate synthase
MKKNKHVKLGELEIPADYFKMSKEDKDVLCNVIMDAMLTVLDKEIKSDLDRIEIFDKILESSIITNQEQEEYEICQVLTDIRTLINE